MLNGSNRVSNYFLENQIFASKARAVSIQRLSRDLDTGEEIRYELHREPKLYLPWCPLGIKFSSESFLTYNDLRLSPFNYAAELFIRSRADPREFYTLLRIALTGEALSQLPYSIEEPIRIIRTLRKASVEEVHFSPQELHHFNETLYTINTLKMTAPNIRLGDFLRIYDLVNNLTDESKKSILQIDVSTLPVIWDLLR